MPRVSFSSSLKRHVPCDTADVPAGTLGAALATVFDVNPQLRSYILDDQGRLRRHVNVFINDRMVSDRSGLSDPLVERDEVLVIQALSGG
jgi:molybdopterin converting factor small subunit